MKISGILVMAGNSVRYGKNTNKNLEKMHGKYIVEYSLEALDINSYITDIILVVRASEIPKVQEILALKKYIKPIQIVEGGNSRASSVYNALKKSTSDLVIIQDAARPNIKQQYINKCIENIVIGEVEGSAVAVKSKDTVKIVDENNVVISTTNRNATYLVQTPQCFVTKTLLKAYSTSESLDAFTDDCMLLEKTSGKIKLVEGDYSNIKLTTKEDFILLSALLEEK